MLHGVTSQTTIACNDMITSQTTIACNDMIKKIRLKRQFFKMLQAITPRVLMF